MSITIDTSALPGPARKVLGAGAPAPMRAMAARGVIPGLKPADIVTVIVALSADTDPKVAQGAQQTLGKLPPPILAGALSAQLQGPVVHALAQHYSADTETVRALLGMAAISVDTLEHLADTASEAIGEVIATNENLLLQHPSVIEKLYMNKRVRMSTADRLLELAVRNGLDLGIPAFKEAAQAIQNELIPIASEEPTPDDVLFAQTEEIAEHTQNLIEGDGDTHEVDDEGEEIVKEEVLPLHAQIAQMTPTQKIRRALLGNSAERLLLVRDTNRLVAVAAVSSPQLNENEAARISASRNVIEDVLRVIARNREFTRNYQVKLNLVNNPRTPFTFASRLIPHLREHDLRSLSKSKNVPGAIQTAVRQQLMRKKR